MSVDVAADYLVMAATLAYLKSRELVPTPEPLDTAGEEGEAELDPREELIRRLLEYQKYKDAAEKLGGRPIEGRNVFGRGMPIENGRARRPPFGRALGLEADRGVRARSGEGGGKTRPTTSWSIGCRSATASTSSSIAWRRGRHRSGSTPAST